MSAADSLAEIQARADKATDGPWHYPEKMLGLTNTTIFVADHSEGVALARHSDTAEFIAHARTDLPALVAALRAVLDLHKPVDFMDGEVICAGCDGGQLDPPLHPCQTYRTIASELGKTS